LEKEHIQEGKMPFSCMKCGSCIDECPQKAISYHVRGCFQNRDYNLFFLYPAFLILAVMSEGMMEGALYRIFLFLTTGSMIHG
jgi:ferredoxin